MVLAAGCVERTLQIRSDPPGAKVYLNDREVGVTPVTVPFDFYGVYDLRLTRDGHRAHTNHVTVAPPWWQWFPLDFVSDVLIPFTLRDDHVHDATLDPLPTGPEAARETAALLERAEAARKAGDLPTER